MLKVKKKFMLFYNRTTFAINVINVMSTISDVTLLKTLINRSAASLQYLQS